MRVFDCQCGWRYIIGETHVYGPLWDQGWNKNIGHLMTKEQFADDYSDCAYNAAMTNPANTEPHELADPHVD